jgi:predicted permease
MTTLWQDVRYGIRMLAKRPGFTIIAVLALALGIGANMAIFSVVNAVILRPLPYKDPEQIVTILGTAPKLDIDVFPVSGPDFVDWRNQNHVFEQLAALEEASFNLTGAGGEPERVSSASASAALFSLLGVNASLGRTFRDEEERAGRNKVVVLNNGLWRRRFNANPALIGQTILLSGEAYTVIGVMPKTFHFPEGDTETSVWVPLDVTAGETGRRGRRNLIVVGRLKRGVSLTQAQTEMEGISQRLAAEYPGSNADWDVKVSGLQALLTEDIEPALLILFGAVGFVLLIACANVANLQLARAAARQKEIAIRLALGASRARLMRQLLTESVLLSLMGGAVALLFALWSIDALVAALPEDVPRAGEIGLDRYALGFTLLVSLLTGVLLGLAPAWQGTKPDLTEGLKEGGTSLMGAGRRNRVRSLLVIGEVALSLLLLIGAGLMLKSFYRLREVKPGVDPHNVVTMQINLPPARYAEDYKQSNFFGTVLERISALPGVASAGATTNLPFIGDSQSDFTIEGRPEAQTPKDALIASYDSVSPSYFRATGIPIVKGRAFTEQDKKSALPVAVISETMARRFFGGEDPIGKHIRGGDSETNRPWLTIIGIAGDVRRYGLAERLRPEIYYPFLQQPQAAMSLVVRTTAADPLSIATAVRREVLGVDKDQPVYDIKTMDSLLAQSIASNRLAVWLLGLFAVLALVLASIGIYGVIAYSVTQRTREIGIRMALGARPRDVLRLVVGQGMMLTLIGIGLGLAGAIALTRLMASLLFSVSPTDPLTFAVISALLAVVALLACYIPARRATKIDPMVALRHE